ncbi:MAG: C40 family peptidase [Actinomycetota bacterium]
MRGSQPRHSIPKYLATLIVAALAASVWATPVQAHEYGNAFKQRKHIKNRGKSAVGSPYRYGGTSRSGFDCSGFTLWTFDGHGHNLPRTTSEQFNLAKKHGYKRVWKRKNLKRGDLVFHKTTSARVGHAGIYVGKGKFVSSTSSSGVRVRSLYDPYYWGKRWVGAVRTPSTINK